jgi:hypothetical protein
VAQISLLEETMPSNQILNDVITSFKRPQKLLLQWTPGSFVIPSGGHLQGINFLSTSSNPVYVLSGSGRNSSYFLTVEFQAGSTSGQVLACTEIAGKPLQHAGGIQTIGHILVVGIEDKRLRDKSRIEFYNLEDPSNPEKLDFAIERTGPRGKSTAGAVGIIRREANNDYLLAVATWDAATIDFYSIKGRFDDPPNMTRRKLHTWTRDGADKSDWQPDEKFLKYQGINLVRGDDERIYLFGFAKTGSKDYMNLYGLDFDKPVKKRIQKIASKHVTLDDGIHFRYGGGVHITSDHNFAIIATEGNPHGAGPFSINMFQF